MKGFDGGLYNVLVTLYAPDEMEAYYRLVERIAYEKNGNSQRGSGSEIPLHLHVPSDENTIAENERSGNMQKKIQAERTRPMHMPRPVRPKPEALKRLVLQIL